MTSETIPAGMKAWAGGDGPPADWDVEKPVKWRVPDAGYVSEGVKMTDHPWRHGSPGWYDIIAYTPHPDTPQPEPTPEVADEFTTVEAWEHDDQRELSLLYNHRADDSLQFNRGQMRQAIRHGRRLATPPAASTPAPTGEREEDAYLRGYAEGQHHALVEREWMQDKAWMNAVLTLVHWQEAAGRTWLVGHEEAGEKLEQAWVDARALFHTKSADDIAALLARPAATGDTPTGDAAIGAGERKDCPHCGATGYPDIVTEKGADKVHPYRVICKRCGCGTAHHGDMKAAWAAWTRRAPTPQPASEGGVGGEGVDQ